VDAVCPILRCIWLFSSDLGGAAGGALEAMKTFFNGGASPLVSSRERFTAFSTRLFY
jgi:hypothetical protein